MKKVRALTSFDHNGERQRGAEFLVSPQVCDAMVKRGLVEEVGDVDPSEPAGREPTSSASPAGQASTGQTSNESGTGGSQTNKAPAKKAAAKRTKRTARRRGT